MIAQTLSRDFWQSRNVWIAIGISATLHISLIVWLAMPRMEIPQIAGGGASFGLSGSGEGTPSEAAAELQDDPSEMQEMDEAETPPEEAEQPLDDSPPLPRDIPLPAASPLPAPRASQTPAPARAQTPPQSRPAPTPPATRQAVRPPAQAQKQQAQPKPAASAAKNLAKSPNDNAANNNSDGPAKSGSGNAATTNYAGRVLQQIARRRKSNTIGPGSAYVRLSIAADGRLEASSIKQSSGSKRFDREAIRLVRRASPFPKPPPRINRNLVVEIKGS